MNTLVGFNLPATYNRLKTV